MFRVAIVGWLAALLFGVFAVRSALDGRTRDATESTVPAVILAAVAGLATRSVMRRRGGD